MAYSSVPIPYIDSAGFHLPAFADVLAAHKADYAGVYGLANADLTDASDQDVEWVTIEALALQETFNLALAIYDSFSPATAQGAGLSSIVKTNGIAREAASYSTQTVTVVGQAFIVLTGQAIGDGTNAWILPSPITIPASGTVDVTATCSVLGAIAVPQGTQAQLRNITRGLQSITFSGVTSPGAAVETDPELKVRQTQSTMLPAVGVVDGIQGAIANLSNVARVAVYENDGVLPDANGIPGHTISAVVDGGDATAIATAIAVRKLSSGTFGTSSASVPSGVAQIPRTVYFFRPAEPAIGWALTVRPLAGFTTDGVAAIQSAIAAWTNGLGIGVDTPQGRLYRVPIARAYAPALLAGTVYEGTFEIVAGSLMAARYNLTPSQTDPVIAFNEAPSCQPANVAVAVLPS